MKPKARAKQPAPGPLLYKVVELSTVDESTIERTLNEWTPQGWKLDGLQFAMRESSKRPSMAFVFFTRQGQPVTHSRAQARLRQQAGDPAKMGSQTAWERLAQLAGDEEHDG